MEVIRETLWKRCLSTPTKPPAKNSNICLSETAYQHKGTRKKCKKTSQAAIIQWQRQCLMDKPHRKPWPMLKQATFLSRGPVHCITPFCSDALVSPPNLYPSWSTISYPTRTRGIIVKYSRTPLFRSPKGNGKKFEIAGFRNNRGSVKGKGKSRGIRSSFEIAETSN